MRCGTTPRMLIWVPGEASGVFGAGEIVNPPSGEAATADPAPSQTVAATATAQLRASASIRPGTPTTRTFSKVLAPLAEPLHRIAWWDASTLRVRTRHRSAPLPPSVEA